MAAKTQIAMMMYICGYRAMIIVAGRTVPDRFGQSWSDERAEAPAG